MRTRQDAYIYRFLQGHARRRVSLALGFTVIELLTAIAILIIVLGLMVSLSRHVRLASADQLSKEILRRLDLAMSQYVNLYGIPPVPPLIADGRQIPTEVALQRNAIRNNVEFVRALRSQGFLLGQFNDLSIAYYDEVRVWDAWGSPIVFMSQMHPAIGMNARGWFFFSAGPDRRYLTRDDNLYSYDQPVIPQ